MSLGRFITWMYRLSLLCLPLIGVGVIMALSGVDTGAGLQPAWLFLAAAVAASLPMFRQRERLAEYLPGLASPVVQRVLWWGGLSLVLVLGLSSVGIVAAPAGVESSAAWTRYLKQVAQLAIMLVFLVWPAVWTRGEDRWTATIRWLAVAGAFQVVYSGLQAAAYFQPNAIFGGLERFFTSNPSILAGSESLHLNDGFLRIPRLRGTMCEPLYLGNFLLFLWPLVLLPGWSRRLRRWLPAGLAALLFMTWSRGAWIGFAFQIFLGAVLVWFGRASRGEAIRWKPGRGFAAGASLAGVALVIGWLAGWEWVRLPAQRLTQAFSTQDWSNLTRLYSMEAAWRAFLLSPWVGIGWGQFGFHFPALADPQGLQSMFTWPVVNNFPLEILCELGTAGFLVFGFWTVLLFRSAVLVLVGKGDARVLATTLSSAGVWLQLLTFSQYNLPHIWLAPGLLMAALLEGESKENRAP